THLESRITNLAPPGCLFSKACFHSRRKWESQNAKPPRCGCAPARRRIAGTHRSSISARSVGAAFARTLPARRAVIIAAGRCSRWKEHDSAHRAVASAVVAAAFPADRETVSLTWGFLLCGAGRLFCAETMHA